MEAFFPFDWSYCHLFTCSFLDGSGGSPDWWLWDFGDGNTSTEQNPTHSYVTYGVYTVTLTVSNDGGLTTDTYSRVIPVGNTPVVSFNRNDLDIEGQTEFIDWTSAFKDFDYTIGSTLAIPVMWDTTVGSAEFNSLPTEICDDDGTFNPECVIFTPEEAFGTAPTVVGAAESGVLFTMEFTEVQFRGITDIFKGKANIRVVVDVDIDGNGSIDQQNQLGTNVDVTNDGLPDPVLVAITSPLEGEQVSGIVPITAATVSSVTADQIEFFVNGSSIGVDSDGSPWTVNWNTAGYSDGAHQLSVVATGSGFAATSPVVNVIVGNTPPTAVITTPISCTGLTCSFDGSGSTATNGGIEDYTWTFLDGTDTLGTRNGVTTSFTFPGDGPYTARLTVTDSVGATGSADESVDPTLQATTFQVGFASDEVNSYLTFPYELCIPEEGEEDCAPGGPPPFTPLDASMMAEFSSIVVIPGGGVIGGDVLEFDVTITNTSPPGSGIVLSAYAFQSKVSESPALASRVGDKLFYGQVVPGTLVMHQASPTTSEMGNVKKNGTSNGLFTGKWKGICINSSLDFIPEFNSGLEDESLECAGNRADTNFDGEPELQTGSNMLGLRPGESQTIRLRLDSGTTDGALHVVEPGTLQGSVQGIPVVGPNGVTYYDVQIDNTGIASPNVVAIPDFGDNKVLRDADGTFNPTFAPLADGYTFDNQIYLTLPRPNFAFTDIIGRNHTCGIYGLTLGACAGGPATSPLLDFLNTGDLVPGVENFAAILRGFGEFYDANGDFIPDENPLYPGTGETRPNFPYSVLCENCGGVPYVPIAEFYVDNGDGTLTRQIVGGTYGDPVAQPYLTLIDSLTAEEIKQEVIPEPDPGGPCQGGERKPACARLGTSAVGEFYDLTVVPGGGINGGDAIEFTIDITNSSSNPDAFLTAFNYQTKSRGLADIGILDGFSQDRRDIRLDLTLTPCTSLADFACWNAALGIGHFPNVIGNGLLFGQMVWTDADAGREPDPVDADQVHVSASGINPVPYWLESVKKNGPFAPILKGNVNFICVKSGLFLLDPDADAGCAGEPAILVDPNGEPVPGNISQRLGLPPGETQSVRIRMEFGDFRGAMLQVIAGTIDASNINVAHTVTGGLARDFDCSDQRELEWCHPENVGENIGYLPNTNATWLTPSTLEDIEYVIINQPGDAPVVMNFQQNFGLIMAMAGFVPSAEFYAPDPNEDLIGTPFEGILIRQQVLGNYTIETTPTALAAPQIVSNPVTTATSGQPYTYQAFAIGNPTPSLSLTSAPAGMTISAGGKVSWTSPVAGSHTITIVASSGVNPNATQTYTLDVGTASSINQPPVASFTYSCTDLDCNFDASGSSDPDGSIVSYEWDFGDGNSGSGAMPGHTYASDGAYTVTLTVTDNDGATAVASEEVTVTASAGPSGNIEPTGQSSRKSGKQTVTWTSAFTNNGYTLGDTILVLAEWQTDCGVTAFNPRNRSSGVTPVGKGFSPGGVSGSAPQVIASGDDWVLFAFEFTQLKNMKGSATFDLFVGRDTNCDGVLDANRTGIPNEAKLRVKVDVTEALAPTITSSPGTTATVNKTYGYQVKATGNPAPSYSLVEAPSGMTINSSTGVITWMPESEGVYDVTVQAANGISPDATQSFQVAVVSGPALVFSLNNNRSNSQLLEGASVSGDVFIFISPDGDIKRVRFWLDNPNGKPKFTDNKAPFDFVGGSLNKAKPFKTKTVSNGVHTIYAELTFKDNSTHVITATFTVGN